MGCSCGKMYVWKLKKAALGIHEYNVVLNSRRDEMLSVETSDDVLEESFVQEWIALTEERDCVIRSIHVEAMRKEMDHTLLQLHYWMQSALTGLIDKEREVLPMDLRRAVMDCYSRVHKYLVTLRGVPILSGAADRDRERDAPDGESLPTPSDQSADSKRHHSSSGSYSPPEPTTPFDQQSIVSDATFESAVSQNSQHQGIGSRYFPNAFSQRFVLAQRLTTTLEITEPPSVPDCDSAFADDCD